jgi:hypothetical protein
MKTTTGILRAIIEICVSKQTSAIYFFEVGMTKMKCQNKRQNEMNLISVVVSVEYTIVANIKRVLASYTSPW